jgi:phosphoribosylformylglycinamidine synthase
MCVGIVRHDEIMRATASGVGNLVVLVGADTGRDGIHGATFASVENPEESHRGVIQVGNPFLEKLLLEACLEVLQTEHVVAMQDLGAAGLTSAVVECASKGGLGIEIDVQHVSRREQGMSAYEVMLSESQERMLVIVRQEGLAAVRAIFDRWDLHSDVIGRVTDDGRVRVLDGDEVVADVPASFYTDECPTYTREGRESSTIIAARARDVGVVADLPPADIARTLLRLLASPNVCSRQPIVRTYDHTILTNTVLGPHAGDAAVVRIKGTRKGLALKTDCNPRYVYLDPYVGGQLAVAEAARNLSCVGAEPLALTNCLNFGSPEKPEGYFQLEQAVRGMALAAERLGTPVVSGNVSLYNESGAEAIFPTPTVGMVGLVDDISQIVGLSAGTDQHLALIGDPRATLGGSEYLAQREGVFGAPPAIDLALEARVQAFVRAQIRAGVVEAAHDTSEGGLLVAICEMLFAGDAGVQLALGEPLAANGGRLDRTLFGEAPSRIVVAVAPAQRGALELAAHEANVPLLWLGVVGGDAVVIEDLARVPVAEARAAWAGGLAR